MPADSLVHSSVGAPAAAIVVTIISGGGVAIAARDAQYAASTASRRGPTPPPREAAGAGEQPRLRLCDRRHDASRRDHDPRRGLEQVGTGTRADNEEERVRHLAVQPDNACQTAKDFALATLTQDRARRGFGRLGSGSDERRGGS